MSAAKQLVGKTVPFGCGAARVTWTGSDGVSMGGVVAEVLSQNVRDNFTINDLNNGDTNIIGRAGHNQVHEATVAVILYDSAGGATEASSRLKQNMPQKLSLVTISNHAVGAAGRTPQLLDGDWNYAGGSYDGKQGDYHQYSFTLWRGGIGDNPAALPLAS